MNFSNFKQKIERYGSEHETRPVRAVIFFDNNDQLELDLNTVEKAPHNDTRKMDMIPKGVSSRTYILCELILMAEENVLLYEMPNQDVAGKKGMKAAVTKSCNKYLTQLITMLSEKKGISRTNIYNKIQQLGKLNPESPYAKDIKDSFSEYLVQLALEPEACDSNPIYHLMKSSVPASYMRTDFDYISATIAKLIRIKAESLERENRQAEENH